MLNNNEPNRKIKSDDKITSQCMTDQQKQLQPQEPSKSNL